MKRNYQLDFFRGFLLLLITVDHFLVDHNVIKRFTNEFVGWVSAAEGFVFISGLTAGLVYTRRFFERGEKHITQAARKRALTIYRNHIALLLLTLLIVFLVPVVREHWLAAPNGYKLMLQKTHVAVMLGAILLYQPIFLDILPMYIIFMLFVPVLIKYFYKGYGWQLALGSCALYVLGQFDNSYKVSDAVLATINTNIMANQFHLLSWQILFFMGLYIGYLANFGKVQGLQKKPLLILPALIISVVLFSIKNLHIDLGGFAIESFADKSSLGIIRLINFAAIFVTIAFISSLNKKFFTYKPVCYLGKYSLEVFSLHILLVIVFRPFKSLFNEQYAVHVTEHFTFYPVGTLMLFLFILPALFLAPTLLKKRKIVLQQVPA